MSCRVEVRSTHLVNGWPLMVYNLSEKRMAMSMSRVGNRGQSSEGREEKMASQQAPVELG